MSQFKPDWIKLNAGLLGSSQASSLAPRPGKPPWAEEMEEREKRCTLREKRRGKAGGKRRQGDQNV